jgi:AcrR family transcriptional regulator
LTKAIGINPSLYAAFGNKETLFRKALDRYVEKTVAFVLDAINETTACQFAERLVHSAADMVSNPHNPPG